MKGSKNILILLIIITEVIFISCREKSLEGTIIFTRTSGNAVNSAIVAIKSNGTADVLTKDFTSAISPDISYDGKCLLFAGKYKSENAWQIFEMNLENRKIRQITTYTESCLYPAYLPGDRIVFSKLDVNDSLKSASPLYTCKMDGTDLKRITFNPDSYSHSTVLKDGRILALTSAYTGQNQADSSVHQHINSSAHQLTFMVMRPDGTKAELFYKGVMVKGNMKESTSGKLFFTGSAEDGVSIKSIFSISYNNPFDSQVTLTSGMKENFTSVYPENSGKILVSYQSVESGSYSLAEFDPDKKIIDKPLLNSNEYSISDAVVVEKRERPKKLPSEVDMTAKTGLLLCQDVNMLDFNRHLTSDSQASSVEIIGINSSLGIVPVEKDGSFFLNIKADIPFRIRILDSKGNVLQNSCNWLWLRPSERRGCVGCHEDPAQVPVNRVPLAVKKFPVNIPAHLNVTKTVSLE